MTTTDNSSIFQPALGTRFVFYALRDKETGAAIKMYGISLTAHEYESDGTLLGIGEEDGHLYFVTPEQLARTDAFMVLS